MLTFDSSLWIEIKKLEKIHFLLEYKLNFTFIPDDSDDINKLKLELKDLKKDID
jgi:hypothetical protein